MADTVRRVEYFYITVPSKPGEGAKVLATLKDAGVNLIAFSGFPNGRKAQLDFVPEDSKAFRAAAKRAGWKVVGPKKGFVVQGDDRVGATADLMAKLAAAGINVIAWDAACAGSGRYGGLFWVDPRQYARAAKVLGAS